MFDLPGKLIYQSKAKCLVKILHRWWSILGQKNIYFSSSYTFSNLWGQRGVSSHQQPQWKRQVYCLSFVAISVFPLMSSILFHPCKTAFKYHVKNICFQIKYPRFDPFTWHPEVTPTRYIICIFVHTDTMFLSREYPALALRQGWDRLQQQHPVTPWKGISGYG